MKQNASSNYILNGERLMFTYNGNQEGMSTFTPLIQVYT